VTKARVARKPIGKRRVRSCDSLSTAECLEVAKRAYEQEGGIAMTVRHYYYKLQSGAIRLTDKPNSGKNAYNFVSRLLTNARVDDKFPWEAVADPNRRMLQEFAYNSFAQFRRVKESAWCPVDIWRGQPVRLELWVEKDAMADFVYGVVKPYRIPVVVCKGFTSATVVKKAAQRMGSGRGWVILYAGDFDPSGIDIERNVRDKLRSHGCRPEITRVALTLEDTLALPSEAALNLKKGDSRYKQFVALYGEDQKGYELDAMPASQLRRKIEEAVASYMDFEAFNEAIALERAVREEAGAALRGALIDFEEDLLSEEFGDRWDLNINTIHRYLMDPDEEGGAA